MELRDQLEEEQREHELEVSEVREKAAEERTSYYRIHESAVSGLVVLLRKLIVRGSEIIKSQLCGLGLLPKVL